MQQMLSQPSMRDTLTLWLPLGLETPVMMPDGVIFLSFFTLTPVPTSCCALSTLGQSNQHTKMDKLVIFILSLYITASMVVK